MIEIELLIIISLIISDTSSSVSTDVHVLYNLVSDENPSLIINDMTISGLWLKSIYVSNLEKNYW